jgi:hypothetical protein
MPPGPALGLIWLELERYELYESVEYVGEGYGR